MKIKRLLLLWLIVCVSNVAIGEVQTVIVDEPTTMHTVFESHNQKVLSNQYGIFMTYVTEQDAEGEYLWHLMRSTDGGETFTSIYSVRDATNPPAIETDSSGNVYLGLVGFYDGVGRLYKFQPSDYTSPISTTFNTVSWVDKFAMAIDESRSQIYFVTKNAAELSTFNLNCQLIRQVSLIDVNGKYAQYPHLLVDENNSLHFAWTYDPPPQHKYESIFYMRSNDGGLTWENMSGGNISIPLYCVTGSCAATEITETSEHGHTTWLANMAYKDDKLHFFYNYYCPLWPYNSDPNYNRYKRFDAQTGALEINKWGFEQDGRYFYGLDGFFSVDRTDSNAPLFLVGHEGRKDDTATVIHTGRVLCMASYDNGSNWELHSVSEPDFKYLNHLGGCRSITDDGFVIGSFSDHNNYSYSTHFLKIPIAAPGACEKEILLGYEPPTADIDEDCNVDLLDFSRLAENWLDEQIPIRPRVNR